MVKVPGRARWGRLASAVGLFFLAPLVGEYLLGNMPITDLPLLLVLAPFYGAGALLIREVTRRLGLGWHSMILMALAYAIVEEGLVLQTLFNPTVAVSCVVAGSGRVVRLPGGGVARSTSPA
jgi:hypothetical protein